MLTLGLTFLGEVPVLEEVPIAIEMSGSIEMPNFSGLQSMMESLMATFPPVPRVAQNPCAQDQVNLGCGSVNCLQGHYDRLTPSCRAYLEPAMPSPSPEPMLINTLIEADIVFTNDGFSPRVEELLQLVPISLSQLFRSAPVQQPVTSSHPCEREIEMCIAETHSSERGTLEKCLSSHMGNLSPSCTCFLHKVLGASAAVAPEPTILALDEVIVVTVGRQHSMCMLLTPVFFVITFLLMRRLVKSCFKPRAHLVAVVAVPEVMVATVEPLVAKPPEFAAKPETPVQYQITA